MIDPEFIALMVAVIGGFVTIFYQGVANKDKITEVEVKQSELHAEIREQRAEMREEFAKCHSHPLSCRIEEDL